MTAPKEQYKDRFNIGNIGRGSFTPAEIAIRNGVSLTLVYEALRAGRLKGSNLSSGSVRGSVRITLKQETEWLERCESNASAADET